MPIKLSKEEEQSECLLRGHPYHNLIIIIIINLLIVRPITIISLP